jgi:uncharacterized protein YndB with AHSA1/START domain
MPVLRSTIEVARPPAEVFAAATDPTRFSEWQRDVESVRVLAGGRFETTRRFAGARRRLLQQVTRDDPPRHWAAQGVEGPIRPHASVTVEPITGGARVTFTLEFEAHGLGVAILPLVRRQAERGAPVSYANLKRLLERGAASSPGGAAAPTADPGGHD